MEVTLFRWFTSSGWTAKWKRRSLKSNAFCSWQVTEQCSTTLEPWSATSGSFALFAVTPCGYSSNVGRKFSRFINRWPSRTTLQRALRSRWSACAETAFRIGAPSRLWPSIHYVSNMRSLTPPSNQSWSASYFSRLRCRRLWTSTRRTKSLLGCITAAGSIRCRNLRQKCSHGRFARLAHSAKPQSSDQRGARWFRHTVLSRAIPQSLHG